MTGGLKVPSSSPCQFHWLILICLVSTASAFKRQVIKLPPKDSRALPAALNLRQLHQPTTTTTKPTTTLPTSSTPNLPVNLGRGVHFVQLDPSPPTTTTTTTTTTITTTTTSLPTKKLITKKPAVKKSQKSVIVEKLNPNLKSKLGRGILKIPSIKIKLAPSPPKRPNLELTTHPHRETTRTALGHKVKVNRRKPVLRRGQAKVGHSTLRLTSPLTTSLPTITEESTDNQTSFSPPVSNGSAEIQNSGMKMGRGVNQQKPQSKKPRLTPSEISDKIRELRLQYDPVISMLIERFESLESAFNYYRTTTEPPPPPTRRSPNYAPPPNFAPPLAVKPGRRKDKVRSLLKKSEDEDDEKSTVRTYKKVSTTKAPERREWGDECTPSKEHEDDCEAYTKDMSNAHYLVCEPNDKICVCRKNDDGVTAEFSKELNICLLPTYYTCNVTEQCAPLLVCAPAVDRDYILEPQIPPGYPKVCRPSLGILSKNWGTRVTSWNVFLLIGVIRINLFL